MHEIFKEKVTNKSKYSLKNLLRLGYSKDGKLDQNGYLMMKAYRDIIEKSKYMSVFKAFLLADSVVISEDLVSWVHNKERK